MATEIEKERIAGKLLLDETFRRNFASNPAQAALELGIELTTQEVEKLQNFDREKLDSMARMLDIAMKPSNLPFPVPPPVGYWGKPPPPKVIIDIFEELDS